MPNDISIFIENGFVKISCQIPVASAPEDMAALVEELIAFPRKIDPQFAV